MYSFGKEVPKMIAIEPYRGKHSEEIISLILHIQNDEAKIGLSLDEQPDLKDIASDYQASGGEFWLATDCGRVVGTIGLMLRENNCAILKKFFVDADYRSRKVGLALYRALLSFAQEKRVKHILLDTPSVAAASHRFYERAGFRQITAGDLPVAYTYPDRDSLLYLLDL